MNITFTSNFVAIYRARNVYQQHMALHYSKIQGQTTRKQSKEKQVQM